VSERYTPVVLFVDDDHLVLRALARIFERDRTRWNLTFATGGRQGLEILETTTVDLLVTDLQMPDIDGAQILAAAKRRSPDARRIVLTGTPDDAEGLDAYLVLPKDRIWELRDVVVGLLAPD
jgi:YesN/AraC family two-component response regulator